MNESVRAKKKNNNSNKIGVIQNLIVHNTLHRSTPVDTQVLTFYYPRWNNGTCIEFLVYVYYITYITYLSRFRHDNNAGVRYKNGDGTCESVVKLVALVEIKYYFLFPLHCAYTQVQNICSKCFIHFSFFFLVVN